MAITRQKSTIAIKRNPIVSPSIRAPNYGDFGAAGLADVGRAAWRTAEFIQKEQAKDYVQEHQYDGLNAEIDAETGAVKRVNIPEGLGSYAADRLDPVYQKQAVEVAKLTANEWMTKNATQFALEPGKMKEVFDEYSKTLVENSSPDIAPVLAQDLKTLTQRHVAGASRRLVSRQLNADARQTLKDLAMGGQAYSAAIATDPTAAGTARDSFQAVFDLAQSRGLISEKATFEQHAQSWVGLGQVQGVINKAIQNGTTNAAEIQNMVDVLDGVSVESEQYGYTTESVQRLIPDPRVRNSLQQNLRSIASSLNRQKTADAKKENINQITNALAQGRVLPGTTAEEHAVAFVNVLTDGGLNPELYPLFSPAALAEGHVLVGGQRNLPMKAYQNGFKNPELMSLEQAQNAMAVYEAATVLHLNTIDEFITAKDQVTYRAMSAQSSGGKTDFHLAYESMLERAKTKRDNLTGQEKGVWGRLASEKEITTTELWTEFYNDADVKHAEMTPYLRKAITGYAEQALAGNWTEIDQVMDAVTQRFNDNWTRSPLMQGWTRTSDLPKPVKPVGPGNRAPTMDWLYNDSGKIIESASKDQGPDVQGFDKSKESFGPGGRLSLREIPTNTKVRMYEVMIDPRATNQQRVDIMVNIRKEDRTPEQQQIVDRYNSSILNRVRPLMDEKNNVITITLDHAQKAHEDYNRNQNVQIESARSLHDSQEYIANNGLMPNDAEWKNPTTFDWTQWDKQANISPGEYKKVLALDYSPKPPKVTNELKVTNNDLDTQSESFPGKATFFLDNPVRNFDPRHEDAPVALRHSNPLALPYTAQAGEFKADEKHTEKINTDQNVAHFKYSTDGALYSAVWLQSQIDEADGTATLNKIAGVWKTHEGPAATARYAVALGKLLNMNPEREFQKLGTSQMVALLNGMTVIQSGYSTIGRETWERVLMR